MTGAGAAAKSERRSGGGSGCEDWCYFGGGRLATNIPKRIPNPSTPAEAEKVQAAVVHGAPFEPQGHPGVRIPKAVAPRRRRQGRHGGPESLNVAQP